MIQGSSCWSAALQRDMGLRSVGEESRYTFLDMPETIYGLLAKSAGLYPDAVALVDDDGRRYAYAELLDYVDRTAAYLACRYDVCAGDRVGLLMGASLEFCSVYFACSKIGAVVVPFSTKYREKEIAQLFAHAELSVLFADAPSVERVGAALACVRQVEVCSDSTSQSGFGFPEALANYSDPVRAGGLDAPAVMMYTSGTTSMSKAVVLTNCNVIHAALTYERLMGTTRFDRTVIPVPIYHVTGLIALLTQFVAAGATVHLHRRFDARRILECIEHEGITYLHASPTAFEKILALREEFPELPSLRVALSGSSYEPVSKMRQFHVWLPSCAFQVVYGLTETASPALLFPFDSPTSIYAGATGKPVPGVDVRIVSDNGKDVETGRVGEILLRGTCVTSGYFNCSVDAVDADGWLATGDMGYADALGMVWVVDRKKDMINRGGEKVWCSCLEEAVCALRGVKEACAAALPDELYGEVPVVAVVPDGTRDLTEAGVIEEMRERVAGFEVPEHVIFVDYIPQTVGDKPNRTAVREAVLEQKGMIER